jgi:hypothetical protein
MSNDATAGASCLVLLCKTISGQVRFGAMRCAPHRTSAVVTPPHRSLAPVVAMTKLKRGASATANNPNQFQDFTVLYFFGTNLDCVAAATV